MICDAAGSAASLRCRVDIMRSLKGQISRMNYLATPPADV